MIAAIYARKSTEQTTTADDQKSVARQIDHARQYAERKGWTVDGAHVYVDDGIGGAEFANRPGYVRLLNALKPKAPFQVLIMAEESRLGREQIETAYALKQLVTAGVRVFFYMEDRERTLDSPTDKIMMSLTAFADELEREKARQRTADAMLRKAKAGHVCGGRVFGFANIEILNASGQRSHVERRINEAEAVVVRRIFALSAQGKGQTTIAKILNAEGALSPRAQQGRPSAWAPSSVREVLRRTLYRGEIVWNRTQKRNPWGQVQPTARASGEWVTLPAPELRIVSDAVWQQVHGRLAETRDNYLRGTNGQLWGRPGRGVESKYLLSGLARCGICNGSMYVKTRKGGQQRTTFYGCTSYHLRGKTVCPNSLEVPMPASDAAVLTAIESDILRPDVLTAALQKAVARLRPSADVAAAQRVDLDKRLGTVRQDLERLTTAIVTTGPVPALLDAITARERQREALTRDLRALDASSKAVDWRTLERDLAAKLTDWQGLLRRQVPQARQVLKKLLHGHIVFQPVREGDARYYTFTAPISLGRLLVGSASANMVASPPGIEPGSRP